MSTARDVARRRCSSTSEQTISTSTSRAPVDPATARQASLVIRNGFTQSATTSMPRFNWSRATA